MEDAARQARALAQAVHAFARLQDLMAG